MTIGGVSVILLLGILNLGLLFFQLFSGQHLIKVRVGIHKKTGIFLFCSAVIHGVLGILVSL